MVYIFHGFLFILLFFMLCFALYSLPLFVSLLCLRARMTGSSISLSGSGREYGKPEKGTQKKGLIKS
jgi:hypothetical protein